MKRLKKILRIKGKLKLLTGLHIGVGKDEVKIGGVDSQVIKNPLTGEPYIPGSSLKGKMRSLLELYYGVYRPDGQELNFEYYLKKKDTFDDERKRAARNILKLFGTSGADYKDFDKLGEDEKKEIERLAVSRLSFYDLELDEESRKKWENVLERRPEEKTEVKINRITGTTHGGALLTRERVPAGLSFDFTLILKIFEGDNEEEFIEIIKRGLALLEADSLGGSGSRGYGKVEITVKEPEEVKLIKEFGEE
ncbi:type III-A CRISPR-associated RAMP protein Csm3 [Thermovibrio sp.]